MMVLGHFHLFLYLLFFLSLFCIILTMKTSIMFANKTLNITSNILFNKKIRFSQVPYSVAPLYKYWLILNLLSEKFLIKMSSLKPLECNTFQNSQLLISNIYVGCMDGVMVTGVVSEIGKQFKFQLSLLYSLSLSL